jgi:hypothetical protein
MPDTIPPNILALTAVTGEHWSSRWWASRAAGAFGMLAWWYMGAYPAPGPPSTPLTPTGDPIPPGGMYFDTTRDQMMVWDGQEWVPFGMPTPASVASLFYTATAGQTVFPLTAGDMFGRSFTLKSDGSNGVDVYLNGVRLTPDDGSGTLGDYQVEPAASTVTLMKGAQAGFILAADVMIPPAQLAPGAVEIKRINPITPDGTTATFTLTCSDGTTLNIVTPFELLVSVDGVIQEAQVQYQTTADTITFVQSPPPSADANIFMQWFMAAG